MSVCARAKLNFLISALFNSLLFHFPFPPLLLLPFYASSRRKEEEEEEEAEPGESGERLAGRQAGGRSPPSDAAESYAKEEKTGGKSGLPLPSPPLSSPFLFFSFSLLRKFEGFARGRKSVSRREREWRYVKLEKKYTERPFNVE